MTPATLRQNEAMLWDKLPTHWPGQLDLLRACQEMHYAVAIVLLLAGIAYLLWGYYLYKWLVTLNAMTVGALIGGMFGEKMGSLPAGALMGAFIAGVVTYPSMKYAVSIMGGIFGALVGGSLWNTFGFDNNFAPAGALMGVIFFGMLSFILFRGSIIMYLSLQGSVMIIFGALGLIFKYQETAGKITDGLVLKPFILPMAIFIPMVLGHLYQQATFPEGGGGEEK